MLANISRCSFVPLGLIVLLYLTQKVDKYDQKKKQKQNPTSK